MLLNLIINALEAMCSVSSGERHLLVSTGNADSGGVLVTVCDSGPGFDQQSACLLYTSPSPRD